jgi:hypothetical protein
MSLFRIAVTVASTSALLFAACGGGGGGGSQPNNASGLESAAEDLWNAIFSGDTGDAYAFLTEDCKEEVSERDFRDTMGLLPALLTAFLGVDADDIKVDRIETRNVEDGEGEALVVLDVGDDDASDTFNEGNDYEDWVYEDGSWRIADCSDFDDGGGLGDDDNDDNGLDEEPDDDAETSRSDPAPLGTTIEVAGWEITINGVDNDATDAILDADEFIDPPEDGDVFVLINVTAKYIGDGESESASLFSSVTWGAVGDSAVAYDEFSDTCTFYALPDDLDDTSEVFEGGTITGDICFSVVEDDTGSLLLYAEESFSFDSNGREWFALR